MKDILNGQLQFSSKTSLQNQILLLLKRNIEAANLQEGDQLPTEEEICEAYGVSRSTVRGAIQTLEEEGSVARVRGKGTFVATAKMKKKSEGIYSFSRQMREMKKVPSSRLVSLKEMTAKATLAKIFQIDPKEKVYELSRIRCADNIPIVYEITYIPVEIIPALDKMDIVNESLYKLLKENSGIEPFEAEENYESIVMNSSFCTALKCPMKSSGFYIERLAKARNGRIFEFTQAYMRGDYSKISITLREDQYTLNNIFRNNTDE